MDIKPINAQIAQAVAALKTATPAHAVAKAAKAAGETAPVAGAGQQGDFVASLAAALNSVSRTQNTAAELQRQFQLENPNVSLEETMIAMNKSQIAFQAAVQVRNRLVQAYEQIMQMPV
jgi:flagellar hook-basal body complex protein FliE